MRISSNSASIFHAGPPRPPRCCAMDLAMTSASSRSIFVVEPKSGQTADTTPAGLRTIGMTGRPEIIAAREMLTISGPLVRPVPAR